MTPYRPAALSRVVALTVVALAGIALSGCDRLPFGQTEGTRTETSDEEVFGACFRPYGSNVLNAAMNKAGSTMLYLTASKPQTVPDDQWQSGDRAVYMQDVDTGVGRHIVLPWSAVDEVPIYATSRPDAEATPRPYGLNEQMIALALSETGDRFAVGVRRAGVEGLIAKVYAGVVPPMDGTEILRPGEGQGLELVPVNDYQGTEGIRSVALSPDGSKLAAVVGNQGEVRIYDFGQQKLSVYTKGPKGTVVVSDVLPVRSSVSMVSDREPAVANTGQMLLTWSPQSDRLAIATGAPNGETALAIMNPVDGRLTGVRRFRDSTVPQVAWSADGQSLFVMTTEIQAGTVFGNTAFRHIAAAEGGKDIGRGGQIQQPAGYRTEPANLVNFGDDQRFLFTWQRGLWRFIAPGGDLTKGELWKVSADAIVPYLPASVAMDKDLALFLGGTSSNQFATIRDAVSRNSCEEGTAGEAVPTTAGTAPAGEAAPSTAAPPTTQPATEPAGAATAAPADAATPAASATSGG